MIYFWMGSGKMWLVTGVFVRREETPEMHRHEGNSMWGHTRRQSDYLQGKKSGLRRNQTCQHLDFELLASRIMRK